VLIGMGAIILEGVFIEDWTIVAAGTVITEDTLVPSKTLIAGIPGKVIKKLDSKHIRRIKQGYEQYVKLNRKYFNEKSLH
jgi:carbonic anhydrase/acetyltransferase-like protein (isoleucine patch superfamily)